MHNFPRRLSPNLNSCVVYSVPPNTLITNTSPAFIRINVTGELHDSDVVGPSFRFDTGYVAKHQCEVTMGLDPICTMTPFDSEALPWDDRIHAGVTNLIASDQTVQSFAGGYFTIPSRYGQSTYD